MHVSVLSVVMSVLVAAVAAGAWWYGRQAARRRARHRAEWDLLAAELRDVDEELDRVWAAGR